MDVNTTGGMIWLVVCFIGIMGSFIAYGIVMEYATSGGRKLHELSLIFVTSLLYSGTAYVGRYVRAEKPTTVAPSRLMVLAITSMGSTYCSVRSLRYVRFFPFSFWGEEAVCVYELSFIFVIRRRCCTAVRLMWGDM